MVHPILSNSVPWRAAFSIELLPSNFLLQTSPSGYPYCKVAGSTPVIDVELVDAAIEQLSGLIEV